MTVLFADLSGFTALSERLDPEDVRALQEDLFNEWASAVYEYQGYVEKFVGDAVMAVFGAPVAHEHDPERAVRAALAMRERMADINRRWAKRVGRTLDLHCGLNSGTVVAGEVGASFGGAYAVTGDTVNTASRLQNAAGPGEILVSDQTYRLTQELCEYQAHEPVYARGKAEPLAAFAVLGLRPQPLVGMSVHQRSVSSPMVGREAETARLVRLVDGLVDGRGQVVGVIGEPGLGKSRLFEEVHARVDSSRVLWLQGNALSYGRTISFWPFREMLRELCAITEEDDATNAIPKLRQRLEPLFGAQVAEVLPYLATLLALELPEELAARVKYLDGDAVRRQIFMTVRRLFDYLAREHPTMLVFEDLHWLDHSSATLLDHLLPLVREVPLAIVGLGRPDPNTPAVTLRATAVHEYADCYTEVRLTPLSDTDSEHLLRNLLRIESVQPRVRDRILAKAEGNPFFLQEVVRSLVDVRTTSRSSNPAGWDPTAELEHLSIPDTVQGVIMARIDRLGPELKDILRLASVVGRTFSYRVLAALTGAKSRLDNDLGVLQELELISEFRQLPELEYMFEHALVQETTYETILVQQRRELHGQVVTCMEGLFADRLEEFYGLLAHHAARAENWDKAQHYLLLAGDQAGRMAADWEALTHYHQAIQAYARAFGDRWDPIERAVLERKIGEALFRRGELQPALEYLYRALALLGWKHPTRRWAVRIAIVQQLLRQAAYRLRPGADAPSTLNDPAGEERVTILHVLSWIMALAEDQQTGVLIYLLLLNEAERSQHQVGIARGAMAVGVLCDYVPQHRLAEFYNTRSIALAEAAGQPVAIGQAYLGQGMHEYATGDWDAALTALQRGRVAYWNSGELRGWGLTSLFVMGLSLRRGRFDDVNSIAQELVRMGQDSGDRLLHGWGALWLGAGLAQRGLHDEGLPVLRQALELCRSSADLVMSGVSAAFLARVLVCQDGIEEACQLVDEGNAALDAAGLRSAGCVNVRAAGAEVYLAVAARASGSERKVALSRARGAIEATMTLGRMHVDGLVHGTCWRGSYEWLNGNASAAHKWWQRSIQRAEKLNATCLTARAYVEIGRYADDKEAVERALELYASVGAEAEGALMLRQPTHV